MKKLNLALLVSASAMLLAGCTKVEQQKYIVETVTMGNTTTGQIGETVRIAPEAIELDVLSATLFIGDELEVGTKVRPLQASSTPVEFTSDDATIASVNANGKITAKKAGETYINAKVQGTDIEKRVKIIVLEKVSKNVVTTLQNDIDAMKAKQDELYPNGLNAVRCGRFIHSNRYSYANQSTYNAGGAGKLVYASNSYEEYVYNHADGYFAIGGYDQNVMIEGANESREEFEWIFRTNESYITYIYHTAGNSKTYLSVDTSSYIGKERFEAIKDILDCIFRSGKELASNPEEWALETRALTSFADNSRYVIAGGSHNDGQVVNYVLQQLDYGYTEASVDESDDEIPAGTAVRQDYTQSITWKEGTVATFSVDIVYRYTTNNLITGVSEYIVDARTITFDFQINDEVQYEIPNNKDYSEVGDIYDL